jgi:hypothetical protein
MEESLGSLFIGMVMGAVIMSEQPPNCSIYNECTVTRVLQLFHTSKHFILGLLDYDTCLPCWTFGAGEP